MSEVADTRFSTTVRDAMVREVHAYLPAYLGNARRDGRTTSEAIADLLALDRHDLTRLTAIHLVQSEAAGAFLTDLNQGLRRPFASTERPPVLAQQVRGAIDWGATIRTRSSAANDRTRFVSRPANRHFSTPENGALAWALRALRRIVESARADDTSTTDGAFKPVRGASLRLDRARRVAWLRGVEPRRPDAVTLRRLAISRRGFYRRRLLPLCLVLLRYESPSDDDLTELLLERHFVPARDWALFEVVVALRIMRRLRDDYVMTNHRLLVGSDGRRPFARFALADGGDVQLWYQSWPGAWKSSRVAATMARSGLRGGTRPDIVVEHCGKRRALILELKATEHSNYLASGVAQLLGYLAEWSAEPTNVDGWVVAPAGAGLGEPMLVDREPALVSADAVAAAVAGWLA